MSIAGYTYRTTVASMGGRIMPPISAALRASAGVAAGDELEASFELDTAPREVAVPADFAAALDADAAARHAFDAVPDSHRLRWVLPVQDATTDATRRRRIDKAVESLREGR